MKKIVLYSLAVFMLAFHSCNKATKPNDASAGTNKNGYITMLGTMTPGELHNQYLTDYYAANPVIDRTIGVLTYKQVKNITLEFTKLLAAKGVITMSSINSFNDAEMARMVNAGYFNADSTYKSLSQILALQLASITNITIRDAQANILNFVGTDQELVIYGQTTLSSLTNLTVNEQVGVDGSGSVLGSSSEFWAAKLLALSLQQKAQIIMDADEMGFEVGYAIGGYYFGYGSGEALMYATYKSSLCSGLAAAVVAKQ